MDRNAIAEKYKEKKKRIKSLVKKRKAKEVECTQGSVCENSAKHHTWKNELPGKHL